MMTSETYLLISLGWFGLAAIILWFQKEIPFIGVLLFSMFIGLAWPFTIPFGLLIAACLYIDELRGYEFDK